MVHIVIVKGKRKRLGRVQIRITYEEEQGDSVGAGGSEVDLREGGREERRKGGA